MIKKPENKTRQPEERELPQIESYLASTFQPVSPRPDFIVNLRSRLRDPDFINQRQISNLHFLLLILGAVAVTVLLVAGVITLVIKMVGASHILRLTERQVDIRNSSI